MFTQNIFSINDLEYFQNNVQLLTNELKRYINT